MALDHGRLVKALAERDTAVAERDALRLSLDQQIAKDAALEHRLEVMEIVEEQRRSSRTADGAAGPAKPQPAAGLEVSVPLSPPLQSKVGSPGGSEESAGSDSHSAAALCGASCYRCAEAVALLFSACSSVTAAGFLCCRAGHAMVKAISSGTSGFFGFIVAIFSQCHLPPPSPVPYDDEEELRTVRAPSERDMLGGRSLVTTLGVIAGLTTLWDLHFGGPVLAMWAPIGAFAGAAGSALGLAVAALCTHKPGEESAVDLQEQASGALWVELSGAIWSIAAASALCACISGVAAWSAHEYEHKDRSRAVLVLDALLCGAFALRNGYKAWRGGGFTKGGKLRLLVGDAGCGCGWPALL